MNRCQGQILIGEGANVDDRHYYMLGSLGNANGSQLPRASVMDCNMVWIIFLNEIACSNIIDSRDFILASGVRPLTRNSTETVRYLSPPGLDAAGEFEDERDFIITSSANPRAHYSHIVPDLKYLLPEPSPGSSRDWSQQDDTSLFDTNLFHMPHGGIQQLHPDPVIRPYLDVNEEHGKII